MEIGIYHANPSDYPRAQSLGIDLIQGVNLRQGISDFDKAKYHGLKIFISKDRMVDDTSYIRPAVKYWYLQDEPDMHQIPVKDVLALRNQFTIKDQHSPKLEAIVMISAL